MSWQTMNKILLRAMIDPLFAEKLLDDPIRTVQESGFDITLEEQQILSSTKVSDVSELSRLLLTQLQQEE